MDADAHADADADAEVVARFFAEVLGSDHRTDRAAEYLAPDFVDRSAADGDTGPSGVAAKLAGLWTALPDGRYEVDQVVSAGGVVAVRSRLIGGARPVDFADFYRVVDGRIAEHWHVVDTAALQAALS
jgi:predicted SnoaL-like aldol condensation-catalyzing enzyme